MISDVAAVCKIRLTDFVLVCYRFTEFLEPFERVIQPEELWLYKNPLVESDHIPKRVMFVSTFSYDEFLLLQP